MLYTFKSPAAANLIMLQPHGARLLRIIGKEPDPKGILLASEMPGAIAALEAAVAHEDAQWKEAVQAARANGDAEPEPQDVSLRQRAKPFIDMLRRCHAAGEDIVWGV